jgi:hypothetical protein
MRTRFGSDDPSEPLEGRINSRGSTSKGRGVSQKHTEASCAFRLVSMCTFILVKQVN